jgi:4-diphosphocytidyl-2-C-methyl-D-erythritol kinase
VGRPGESGAVVRALARAKLTLSLRVLGRRPDGYHDLEALVVSLTDPHDVLEMELAPELSLVVDGPAALGVPTGDDNLALRAARCLLELAGNNSGLQLRLTKRIPAGAGLGGGSADAAATLVAGVRLLGLSPDQAGPGGGSADAAATLVTGAGFLGPSPDQAGLGGGSADAAATPVTGAGFLGPSTDLVALAAELGSDVPFCLTGGVAWMRGRGELLEPLAPLAPLSLAVVVPPFAISTAAVYAAWDNLGGPRSERVIPAPPAVAVHVSELSNDLEPAAEAVEPRLGPFRKELEDLAGAPALLAGSGSAFAVPLPSTERSESVAALATTRLRASAFAAEPDRGGVES